MRNPPATYLWSCFLLAAPVAGQVKPPKHVNHLAKETSPYLLSHKNNPVDWYPWGKEALEKAKKEDKPIFLSIGYSACHWCHVMERECFESEAIAAVMNKFFVCIKVDREERPDLDQIYMTAVQAMNEGRGGWPMSVWMTPDLKPFLGGTYFPPEDTRGRRGFRGICQAIGEAWKDKRDVLANNGDRMATYLRRALAPATEKGEVKEDCLPAAARDSATRWDAELGGFAGAKSGYQPKFPHASELSVLLLHHARNGDEKALKHATHTLVAMRRGGIYDQVGGGFHRYSTDRKWLVPHFEKMLYDNALLVQTYLDAWLHTGDAFHRDVAVETLDYMLREMQGEKGGFYSATDADSEGVEGKFFVWSKQEIDALLGSDAALFAAAFGVTEAGNWHEMPGQTVLSVVRTVAELAKEHSVSEAEVQERLRAAKATLYEVRRKRVPPLCDDKVLVSWNGMAIAACAVAYKALGEARYLKAGQRAADFVLRELRTAKGRLLRTWRGGTAKYDAYLEDYAYLADALLHLFEADFDPRWLGAAKELLALIEAHFRDPADGSFFFTSDDHAELIARSKTVEEGAIPSGAAMAILAFARAGLLLEDEKLVDIARAGLEANHTYLTKYPTAVMTMVQASDLLLNDPREVVIAGAPGAAATDRLLARARATWPARHVVTLIHDGNRAALAQLVPGHAEKTPQGGVPTAYVCRFGVCDAPVTDPAKMRLTGR